MKRYKVTGNFKGKRINEDVSASSVKQAKLKAGFNSGFGGYYMKDFINSKTVKASEK